MSILTGQSGLDRYKKLDKLGEGTYGLVYRARDLKTNETVAIKKIKLDSNEEGIPATTLREVSLLQHLKHRNIVEMNGVLYNQGDLYLIFEFMDCDLKKYLDRLPSRSHPTAKTVKRFVYYLTEGIRYCHTRRILHRDLKPQNLLVSDEDGQLNLKIADFGLGREHGLPIAELTHEVVTLWYRPPEILLGKKRYSGSADIWGIGCIMAEIATKLPLFAGDSEIDQLFQIYRILGTPNPKTWPGIEELPDYKPMAPIWRRQDLGTELQHKFDSDGLDLLSKTLIYAPNERITAKQMLLHRWFDEIRPEMIAIFGNVFPHCGSERYQLGCRGIEDSSDGESDEDYVTTRKEIEDEDTDLEDPNEEYDDDDDIDHCPKNRNRWRNEKHFGGKQRENHSMDEDE